MTMPPLCPHHASVYATRTARLGRIRHPGNGKKALAREAATIARQCPQCTKAA